MLIIKTTSNTSFQIKFYDITGRQILCYKILEMQTIIDLSKIPQGIYFYGTEYLNAFQITGLILKN